MKRHRRSRAKYSPMQPVRATAVVEEVHPGSHRFTSITPTTSKSNPLSTDATRHVPKKGALERGNQKEKKARIASEEKYTDSSDIDLVTVEDSTDSFLSNRATFGDNSDNSASVRASFGRDSVFSAPESLPDSATSIGDSVPLSFSSTQDSIGDSISSFHNSTPVRNFLTEVEDRFGSRPISVRMTDPGRMEPSENGGYRLKIYIDGDEAGDDTPGASSRADSVDSDAIDYRKPIPEHTPVANGQSIVASNFENAPTIKVSEIEGRTPDLRLPLDANNDCCTNEDRGLSPTLIPRSGSNTSTISRRDGSSTPRLRISTARATPTPTPDGNHAIGEAVTSTAPKAQEAPKKQELRSGPSSRRTVVVIAGLFVVGLILILSGIIVLSVEEHMEFRIAGGIFLGLGIVFFIICLILQKKNVKKLVGELEKDLFFLNVTDNKIWNFIFHFDEQLAWS